MMEINLLRAGAERRPPGHACDVCRGACEACCYTPRPEACPWCPEWAETWGLCFTCVGAHLAGHGEVSPARFRMWLCRVRGEDV